MMMTFARTSALVPESCLVAQKAEAEVLLQRAGVRVALADAARAAAAERPNSAGVDL